MKLYGRNLSPFTRRVAIAMTILGIPHEREYLSVVKDPQRAIELSPVGRVPALALDDGTTLIESGAILDYLMELAGPEKSLIPANGKARRDCLQLMAIACGALDKAVAAIYEKNRRPPEKLHQPWRELLLQQSASGLKALDAAPQTPWLQGAKMTMADITAGVVIPFLRVMLPETVPPGRYPNLEALAARCEALPAFQAHPLETP